MRPRRRGGGAPRACKVSEPDSDGGPASDPLAGSSDSEPRGLRVAHRAYSTARPARARAGARGRRRRRRSIRSSAIDIWRFYLATVPPTDARIGPGCLRETGPRPRASDCPTPCHCPNLISLKCLAGCLGIHRCRRRLRRPAATTAAAGTRTRDDDNHGDVSESGIPVTAPRLRLRVGTRGVRT